LFNPLSRQLPTTAGLVAEETPRVRGNLQPIIGHRDDRLNENGISASARSTIETSIQGIRSSLQLEALSSVSVPLAKSDYPCTALGSFSMDDAAKCALSRPHPSI